MESFSKETLERILKRRMPYGKYKGVELLDIPVSYLEWYSGKGWPQGLLGQELAFVYEIKLNGLMPLIKPLRKKK